jgi:hypothetical protein
MVKLFTIVKDECDIVREWIIYHGCMFGWNNIYVIDNYSTDGTYEIIQEFKDLIHISREPDYRKKGEYMTNLINRYCNGDETIAFPLDIDEFIVYYDKNTREVSIDKSLINNYINNLPPCRVYKANYLYPILRNENGYNNACKELDYSKYCDGGNFAKSFVNKKYFNGVMDHGNHLNCSDYYLTNIVLVHYHHRNIEQMRKKILNNVVGLGHNINNIYEIIRQNPLCEGCHHIYNLINLNENKYKLPYEQNIDINNCISIIPLKERIIGGFF